MFIAWQMTNLIDSYKRTHTQNTTLGPLHLHSTNEFIFVLFAIQQSLTSTDFCCDLCYFYFICSEFHVIRSRNWNKCSYKNYFFRFLSQTTQQELLQRDEDVFFSFFSGEFAKKAVCCTYLRLTMYNLYWFLCFLWSTLLRAATAFYRFDCCLTCALSIHEDQLFFVRFEWKPFSALFFSRRDVAIHRDLDVHNSSQASAWMVHCSSKIFNAIFFTLRECLRMLECDWEWLALLKFTQTTTRCVSF